jgi:uncharacterized ion transporter superfamily protein YfcC
MAAMLTWILPGGEFDRELVDVNGTPTSPALIGVLGVAKIPYEKWLKWVLTSGKRFLFPPNVLHKVCG